MNFLKAGASMLGGNESGGLNPLAMFKQLDKNGGLLFIYISNQHFYRSNIFK